MHKIVSKFGFPLCMVYVIYRCFMYQDRWGYSAQDRLIEQHNALDDIHSESPADIMDLEEWSDTQSCAHKKNTIVFLKTHKTGSSTMASIFNRFADLHRLDVAIPKNDNRFNWPVPFTRNTVQISRLKDKLANVLNNHLVFNRAEINRLMKPGSIMVTLLRDPVDQFYSTFHYLKLAQLYGLDKFNDPIEEFIKTPNKFHTTHNYSRRTQKYYEQNLLHNGNLYDLNYQNFKGKEGNQSLVKFITEVENTFHLVMITEKFDESLMLLKKMMCWNFMDLVYEKKHVVNKLPGHKYLIKDDVARAIKEWNNEDAKLYRHFDNKLNAILVAQPKDFPNELSLFRKLNKRVVEYCNRPEIESKHNIVLHQLKAIGEAPPQEFLKRPNCFCNKLKRNSKDYILFFAKRFPPYYFMENMKTPREMDGC